MKLKSDFALLDVTKGRAALANHLLTKGDPVPVTIKANIVSRWGNDDGTSIEFELAVDSVTVEQPAK